MYIPGGGCVFQVVTTYVNMFACLTLNLMCARARSAGWDQYCKTALQLAEANNHEVCVYLLKKVRE